MAGTRLRGGVDGLPAAGMQADCRSLQMIAVAFCGSHDVKGVVDLRSAELRLVCADNTSPLNPCSISASSSRLPG